MSAEQWMAATSLLVSLAVLIFGAIQYRAVARKDYVEELSTRISDCERRHREAESGRVECERERDRLTRLYMELMQELRELRAPPPHPAPSPEPA